jgi:hypothetical protein
MLKHFTCRVRRIALVVLRGMLRAGASTWSFLGSVAFGL